MGAKCAAPDCAMPDPDVTVALKNPGTAGLDYGIGTIQSVSQRIWANLDVGPRPLDRRQRARSERPITRR